MIDFLPLFWSQGGNLVDPDGKPVFGQEPNRAYLLNALDYYRGLVLSGAAPARVASIVSYDELVADAVAGRTAMMVNGDWVHSIMRAAMPPEQFGRWAVSMLPGPTTAHRSTASGGWSFAAFTKDPAKVAACMDLVRQVYLGPAVVALKRLPTSPRLFDTLPMFQDPFYQQVKAFLKESQVRPSLPIYVAISNSLQIAISEVLAGLREPDAALATAVARVDREAARYGDAAAPR
jgi:multiple sugar transport system substrate-binding protein